MRPICHCNENASQFCREISSLAPLLDSQDDVSCLGIKIDSFGHVVGHKVYRSARAFAGTDIGIACIDKQIRAGSIDVFEYESDNALARLNLAEKLNLHFSSPSTYRHCFDRIRSAIDFVDLERFFELHSGLMARGDFECSSFGIERVDGQVVKSTFYLFPVHAEGGRFRRSSVRFGDVADKLSDLLPCRDVCEMCRDEELRIVACTCARGQKPKWKLYFRLSDAVLGKFLPAEMTHRLYDSGCDFDVERILVSLPMQEGARHELTLYFAKRMLRRSE